MCVVTGGRRQSEVGGQDWREVLVRRGERMRELRGWRPHVGELRKPISAASHSRQISKTEKTIEIHLVRLTEVCCKVLSEK